MGSDFEIDILPRRASRIEQLKQQREEEEAKRQAEIERLKAETAEKRMAELEKDIVAYEKIANSPYGKDMAPQAWQSLASKYAEAGEVPAGDSKVLRKKSTLPDYTDPVTGMKFMLVKGGCFQMGDTFGDGDSDEKPVHKVCVDDHYIGKYEVTQGQ